MFVDDLVRIGSKYTGQELLDIFEMFPNVQYLCDEPLEGMFEKYSNKTVFVLSDILRKEGYFMSRKDGKVVFDLEEQSKVFLELDLEFNEPVQLVKIDWESLDFGYLFEPKEFTRGEIGNFHQMLVDLTREIEKEKRNETDESVKQYLMGQLRTLDLVVGEMQKRYILKD